MLRTLPVLRQVRDVEGWLLDDEVDLLLAASGRAASELPDRPVVEVGSYCGRSTIVLASAVAAAGNSARVHAIDPHEGEVGAAGQGTWSAPPTLERFHANLDRAGLRDHVVTIQQRSYEVSWDQPIGFLLIDGLHDRENVERDFRHFEPWLDPHGYVAFHDYAHYYPDVVAFVDELVAGGAYEAVDRADSLIVLTPSRRGPATRTRAVVTMVRNEAVFLPIWLGYYSRFFAPEDIYLIDDGSSDGSTDGDGFVRLPVSSNAAAWGVTRHHHSVQAVQHDLIGRYDTVLCTDVDEIVAPDPQTGDLGDYIDDFEADWVTCAGYEVIHMRDSEPPFDQSRPVLAQRGHWFASPAYSKPLLARVPMEWTGGFHGRLDGLTNPDAGLVLLHLRRMDFGLCLARNEQRVARTWSARDLAEGWAYQSRIAEPEALAEWFYNDTCAGVPLVIEAIPERWRGLV